MLSETLILFIHRPPVSDNGLLQAPQVSSGSDSDSHYDTSETETETSPPSDIKFCSDSSAAVCRYTVQPRKIVLLYGIAVNFILKTNFECVYLFIFPVFLYFHFYP